MLDRLIERRIAAREKALGVPLEYLRHIARASVRAFAKFALFTPLAAHRRALPAAAYHVARLAASRHDDCGECLQTEVNLARAAGVRADTIRAVLEDGHGDLEPELVDIYWFATRVAEGGDDPERRERILQRHGEEGLVELALAIAACRVFPTAKRALGHAVACRDVSITIRP